MYYVGFMTILLKYNLKGNKNNFEADVDKVKFIGVKLQNM